MHSRPLIRRLALRSGTLVAAAVLVLTGCGSSDSGGAPAGSVKVVAGDAKTGPKVTIDALPYAVTKTETKVLKDGTGDAMTTDDIASVNLVVVNGKDGKTLESTYGKTPASLYLGQETLLKGLATGLVGQKKGSQLQISVPPADAFGSQGNSGLGVGADDTLVFVVDVLGSTKMLKEATGAAVAPKADLPAVEMVAGKPAKITSPKKAAPTKLVVQPLVTGTGAEVQPGQTVRVTYTGSIWATNEVFDSSASHEPGYFEFPAGAGQVIKAWDNGIVGQKVGSRVLLVVPPADGYGAAGSPPKIKGTDTLVFVVDILAAY